MTGPIREIELVWHELTPRLLEVARVVRVTPKLARVTFTGTDLDSFCYLMPDDHVKVFFPEPGADLPVMPTLGEDGLEPPPPGSPLPIFRDYTVRYVRPEQQELDIDFVLHGHGPAGSWAAQAAPGQKLGVLGPRGSHVNPMNFDWYLVAGDETALPAIGGWLEKVPAGVPVYAIITVPDAGEEQPLVTTPQTTVTWVHRDRGEADLERAIRDVGLPAGDGYCWVAGEATMLKPIRRYLRRLGLPKDWVEVDGYWKRGTANLDHHDDDDD